MKKTLKSIFLILFLIIGILTACFFYASSQIKALGDGKEIIYEVSAGSYSKTVLQDLQEEGMIKNSAISYYYQRFKDPSSLQFKAGKYALNSNMTPNEICSYLSNGENAIQDTVTVTFLEGDWLKDYAAKIAQSTSLTKDELLAAWSDREYVSSLMQDYSCLSEEIFRDDARYYLEGYLFPDTYEFFSDTDVDTLTRKLLDQTEAIYLELKPSFDQNELSIHEIFTLASIVQYEASNIEDMKKVASVFFNRMAAGMYLQSSVTVCYALDINDGNDWVSCEGHSDYDSPYNTYLYPGLPPGPIVAPGKDALEAVLHPDDTDYFYFIGDVCGDGSVYFAQTYQQHLQNIEEYLWCY